MDDVFKDAMKQMFKEAPPELTHGFKQKMGFIQAQYKHSKTTVQSCLDGMEDPPTLLELLVAAYVVNGGLLFKHGEPDACEEDSAQPAGEEEGEGDEDKDSVQSNGTVKHSPDNDSKLILEDVEAEEEDDAYTRLMREMDELNCGQSPLSAKTAPATPHLPAARQSLPATTARGTAA